MNAVVVIGIGRDNLLDLCLETVERYCKKYSLALEVIREVKYGYKNSPNYHYINFEKNQVYEYFDKYERILRLDSDVLITNECPNIFEEMPNDKFCAVPEDIGPRKLDRRNQIATAAKSFGSLMDCGRYFNSGVVLASKEHREIFNIQNIDITKYNLGPFKEQTLLNYNVCRDNIPTHWMTHKYNHMSMFDGDVRDSFIIHYAGAQAGKEDKMRNDLKWIIK
jgi:lipopolysaccharide biosynthesis glycosyltransferase